MCAEQYASYETLAAHAAMCIDRGPATSTSTLALTRGMFGSASSTKTTSSHGSTVRLGGTKRDAQGKPLTATGVKHARERADRLEQEAQRLRDLVNRSENARKTCAREKAEEQQKKKASRSQMPARPLTNAMFVQAPRPVDTVVSRCTQQRSQRVRRDDSNDIAYNRLKVGDPLPG